MDKPKPTWTTAPTPTTPPTTAAPVNAVVRGRVLDAAGKPLPKAMVVFYGTEEEAEAAFALTDAEGRFEILLTHGTYVALATAEKHASRWWPDAVDRADANPFAVAGDKAVVLGFKLASKPNDARAKPTKDAKDSAGKAPTATSLALTATALAPTATASPIPFTPAAAPTHPPVPIEATVVASR